MLVKVPHIDACAERRAETSMLLSLFHDGKVDDNTRKICEVLLPYLQECACNGTLPLIAFNFIFLLAILISGDTQEVEGLNNVCKNVVKAPPRSGLALVSCRAALRKLLGLGRADAKRSWKSVCDRFNELHQAAIYSAEKIDEVLGNHERFATAAPQPFLGVAAQMANGAALDPVAKAWTLKWYWSIGKQSACETCMFVGDPAFHPSSTVWLVGCTYRLNGWLVRCSCVDRSNIGEDPLVQLQLPIHITEASHFFQELAHTNHSEVVSVCTCKLFWMYLPESFGVAHAILDSQVEVSLL